MTGQKFFLLNSAKGERLAMPMPTRVESKDIKILKKNKSIGG
jgi:hypothetical protein